MRVVQVIKSFTKDVQHTCPLDIDVQVSDVQFFNVLVMDVLDACCSEHKVISKICSGHKTFRY